MFSLRAFWRPLHRQHLAAAVPFTIACRRISDTCQPVFDKILIANRGEIACRVIRTARRMGIKSVAIYSDADANAMHVQLADEAICVGPYLSSQSYLSIPNIMAAIRQTGAQAVHPGYGFLSENSTFAESLEAEGVSFIGPGSKAIVAMGDKIESKHLARSAGVNTIPGFLGVLEDTNEVLKVAHEIGYPVMIKASAGGGGKGMRIAHTDEEAVEGFQLAKDEAMSSFGDDRIFVEKFVENPRHIEIQLIADKHGNIVYLPERECSIQRRNQKVLEEAPSKCLDEATRKRMGEQAVALAKAVDYCSAGTVEFLVDDKLNHYFLEMNTRLQVEHPVTECVTGLDLVQLMIQVAAGQHLPLKQEDVTCTGWAMESRVYAEDPIRGFLPSVGTLHKYREPVTTPTAEAMGGLVRCDSGVYEGCEISMHYDPMISKLITFAPTREQTIELMREALDTYVIHGLEHNIPFLRSLCDNPKYVAADITTNFIEAEYPSGFRGVELVGGQIRQLIAGTCLVHWSQQQQLMSVSNQLHPTPLEQLSFQLRALGESFDMEVVSLDDCLKVSCAGPSSWSSTWQLHTAPVGPTPLLAATEADGTPILLQVLNKMPASYRVQLAGAQVEVAVGTDRSFEFARHMKEKPKVDQTKMILSPMPGTLLQVLVEAEQEVLPGQAVAVVEAMKMQNVLRATSPGVVKAVHAAPSQSLSVDELIIELE